MNLYTLRDFEQAIAYTPLGGVGIELRFSHCAMPIAIMTANGMRVLKARRITPRNPILLIFL